MAPAEKFFGKGSRVAARWFETPRAVSLAGMQMKMEVTSREVAGVIRHIHSDRPDAPVNVTLLIEVPAGTRGAVLCARCKVHEVEVRVEDVVDVLGDPGPAPPPPAADPPVGCDHGLSFDQDAADAEGLSAHQVRHRWPRLFGPCPKGCGHQGPAYASMEHKVYGDW